MRKFFMLHALALMPLFQAEGGGAGAGDPPPADPAATAAAAAAAAAAAETPPAAAKWYQDATLSAEEQQWLAARGLTDDNPLAVMPKLVKGHRAAEQRIGKGLDSIIEKPGKDQPPHEWLRANAAALGLPETAEAYEAKAPDFWPKDLPWDGDLEAQARKVAFDMGVTPAAHQAYVNLFAQKMKAMDDASSGALDAAKAAMMTDLQRDFGGQTGAVIARAQQAAQIVAEKAGLSSEALEAISHTLADKTGDAGVIRLFAAIGELAGEDGLLGRGGGGLGMTPVEARAQLAQMTQPGGAWYEASMTGDAAKMRDLKPQFERLSKLAAG